MKRTILFLSLLVLLLLSSCRTREVVRIETKYRDSIVSRYSRDSIYFETKDSVYVYAKNDTVMINRYKTIYRDKIQIRNDTVTLYKEHVEVEKITEKPGFWQQFLIKSGKLSWLLLLAFGAVYFIRKRLK